MIFYSLLCCKYLLCWKETYELTLSRVRRSESSIFLAVIFRLWNDYLVILVYLQRKRNPLQVKILFSLLQSKYWHRMLRVIQDYTILYLLTSLVISVSSSSPIDSEFTSKLKGLCEVISSWFLVASGASDVFSRMSILLWMTENVGILYSASSVPQARQFGLR